MVVGGVRFSAPGTTPKYGKPRPVMEPGGVSGKRGILLMNTIALEPYETEQYFTALSLAGWGFQVFPCAELAKHPAGHPREGKTIYRYGRPVVTQYAGKEPLTGPGGYKHATNNEARVQRWWMEHPLANIGARVFPGHVVVDIDPRNGGDDTWDQLTAGHTVPPTLITRTGSGGRHIWFKLPSGREVKGKAGEGIDLKTHKGYVIMPGSIHPTTGEFYVVEQWAVPAMLPPYLEEHVYRPRPMPRVIDLPRHHSSDGAGLINFVADLQSGNRHDGLLWAAFTAAKEGLDIRSQLLDAAPISADFPENEAQRIINDGHRAGMNAPKDVAA